MLHDFVQSDALKRVCRGLLGKLPSVSMLPIRSLISYAALSPLALFNNVDFEVEDRVELIDAIYDLHSQCSSGFFASEIQSGIESFSYGDISMTFTTISVLIMLGDDLQRVNRESVCRLLRECYNDATGSFLLSREGEMDVRATFSAIATCKLLNINLKEKNEIQAGVLKCQMCDGGFGQSPGLPSHGGSTFCAISSLLLLQEMGVMTQQSVFKKCARWCLRRHNRGFHGREGKDDDTCYGFWIGGTLRNLGYLKYVNKDRWLTHLGNTARYKQGAFAKFEGTKIGDPIHLCFGCYAYAYVTESANVDSIIGVPQHCVDAVYAFEPMECK
ncbi:hypothetical protein PCE1_003614 [Barthelona sp. PCE]